MTYVKVQFPFSLIWYIYETDLDLQLKEHVLVPIEDEYAIGQVILLDAPKPVYITHFSVKKVICSVEHLLQPETIMTNPQIDLPVLKNEAEALARKLADTEFTSWTPIMEAHAKSISAVVEVMFPGYHPQQAVVLRDGSVLTALPSPDQTELYFVGYHSLQDLYNSLSSNLNKDKH